MATASEAQEAASNWLNSCRTGIRVPKSGVIPQQAPAPQLRLLLPWAVTKATLLISGEGGLQSLETMRMLIFYTQGDISELREGSKVQENGKHWLELRQYNLHTLWKQGAGFQLAFCKISSAPLPLMHLRDNLRCHLNILKPSASILAPHFPDRGLFYLNDRWLIRKQ